MFTWIADNAGTIAVLLILSACVIAAVWKMASDKRNGKSSCIGGCSGCPMSGSCQKRKEKDPS